ncbi:MAG: hypothetical protein DRO99_02895 [Candidatus Aenigmatarchaeota archaeon]|nr:MAG: hypothetical protein DRO99_02895 [Candidatus Aenigmarchaeota archaeon]
MKKWIAFCTVVLALLFTITANTQTAQAATIPYDSEGFDDTYTYPLGQKPDEWEAFQAESLIQDEVYNSASQAFKVIEATNERDAALTLDNLGTTDNFTYSMAVYVPLGALVSIGLSNPMEKDLPLNRLYFYNDEIYFLDRNGEQITVDYFKSDSWCEVSVEIDGFTGSSATAKVTVDGTWYGETFDAYNASDCGSELQLDCTMMTGNHFYVDDVVVIPEPATLGMLGLGGLLMVARRQRRS